MRQCEYCGAHLDPEEHCDCQNQKLEVREEVIVSTIQGVYPGFDRSLWSKAKKPSRYGIMFIPRLRQLLALMFPNERVRGPVRENRKNPNRYYFRLNDEASRHLQKAMLELGVKHVQDFILMLLNWYFDLVPIKMTAPQANAETVGRKD